MPPLPIQATWSPDVIATVVYRITMVFVSLTYIWRKYRQPLRTDDFEVKSDETPEPSPANSIDSNDILQTVQAAGTVAAMLLGTTDCDGTSDTPTINVELQAVQNASSNRRQGFNKSSKDG
ncbi:uncharacterized protein EAF02_004533 [Botrytis sinoallii]|uniref:uncharacterized protein n=1 Tax=Botrytis sinoallii TaxID=1463999 RepID=UPI0018FF3C1D|nr:uncharacterized protein EAF02_004533 [Botrytis sinoallii]KAF7884197.1 hypothetical protein EAF02_004533 [Botrytis sinoallii]